MKTIDIIENGLTLILAVLFIYFLGNMYALNGYLEPYFKITAIVTGILMIASPHWDKIVIKDEERDIIKICQFFVILAFIVTLIAKG